MPRYTVYEKQILIVAHEVEADNEYDATFVVQARGLSEYDYVIESDATIENVELTENKMLAFPSMLYGAATQAGMKTPEFGDNDEYDRNEFPHFAVFCAVQLGRRMSDMGEHWGNAKVIAEISDDEIRSVTLEDLIDRGLSWSN